MYYRFVAESFGERLDRLMKERDLNQAELARLADVEPASIHGYLKSNRRVGVYPRIDIILKLCKALRVTPNDLLGGDYLLDIPKSFLYIEYRKD